MIYLDHLIIGCLELEKSKKFYAKLFLMKKMMDFVDTGTGTTGVILGNSKLAKHFPQILLVPFNSQRLPNPQHLAFRVSK